MTSVLRSATTWIIAALLGISVYSVMMAQQLTVERDLSVERAERTVERNEQMRQVMDWQRDQMGELHRAIKDRDRQLALSFQHIDASRESARAMEREDDEIAGWAGTDVDGSIVEWLRQLRAADASALDSVADGADLPDEAATSAEQDD